MVQAWSLFSIGGVPLFDLTDEPGPWRLVLVEDDQDYHNFSRRRNSDPFVKDIWTYDMADGTWSLVKTGISADSHHWNDSDDLLEHTGVRRITAANVSERIGGFAFNNSNSVTKYVIAKKGTLTVPSSINLAWKSIKFNNRWSCNSTYLFSFYKFFSNTMKKAILIIFCILCSISCTTGTEQDRIPPKRIPDHTPYIAGLIEASPDTTHHYPEVVVGYFTDNFISTKYYRKHKRTERKTLLHSYPGIYSPQLLTQLLETSIYFALSWEPEPNATVSVRGPLRMPQEKTVTFIHEGRGIYGDVNYDLERVPNGRYKLLVKLPDGRTYQSITHIPAAVSLELPNSVGIQVKLKHIGDGIPKERNSPGFPIPINAPANSFITVYQKNESIDRDLLLLEPGEEFKFNDRSPYLRAGSTYYISLSKNNRDFIYNPWGQLDKPKSEIWMYSYCWVRLSFFSKGVGRMYQPIFTWFTTGGEWSEDMFHPYSKGFNDTTYLFDVSTIYKVSKNGNVLPKDSSDAIGFFGGYYSRYKRYTMYPIRPFDLDSVLAATK